MKCNTGGFNLNNSDFLQIWWHSVGALVIPEEIHSDLINDYSLVGTIWALAIFLSAGNNLLSSWQTPPGRLFTTISKLGMTLPMVITSIVLFLGLVIMGMEYFRKE